MGYGGGLDCAVELGMLCGLGRDWNGAGAVPEP